MAQYMLLLHQAPNYNMDLPREKMMEMTKRYMAWADGLRQKGKLVGGEKLTAGGGAPHQGQGRQAGRQRRPLCRGQGRDRRLFRDRGQGCAPRPRRSPATARISRCPPPTGSRSGRSTTWPRPARPPAERPRPSAPVHRLVDSLARDSASRLVAALARRLGAGRIAVAEDAVQHALLQALSSWPFKGVPAQARSLARRRRPEPRARPAAPRSARPRAGRRAGAVRTAAAGERRPLRSRAERRRAGAAVRRLPSRAVARDARHLCAEDGVRPHRAADRRGPAERAHDHRPAPGARPPPARGGRRAIEAPPPEALPERAESVRTALYLMFNEGYSASSGEALVQPEFCVEAVRLARALAQHPMTTGPASDALAALLALTAARLSTRVGPDGVAQLLEDQPRDQWDHGLIALGLAHLERSARRRGADGLASARRDRLAACHGAQRRGDRLAAHRRDLRPAARARSLAGGRAGARRGDRPRRGRGGGPAALPDDRRQSLRRGRARRLPGGARPRDEARRHFEKAKGWPAPSPSAG